jgi:hypothetical protein
MTMTTKKLPAKKVTPAEQIAKLELNNAILEQAIYMDYDDKDEILGLLFMIIQEADKSEPNLYMLRRALKGLRTSVINNQHSTMDCAGLDY